MNKRIYGLHKFADRKNKGKIDTLIIAYRKDKRSLFAVKKLIQENIQIKNIIVINFQSFVKKETIIRNIGISSTSVNYNIIDGFLEQQNFVASMVKIFEKIDVENLCLDISSMNVLQMFLILKLLKIKREGKKLTIFYTIPFNYSFPDDPFTSYKSYLGDLKTTQILGFSGSSEKTMESNLIIFLGFEGMLSLKIIEDIDYRELTLVNGLPSFFPKYKDITVINNYESINQYKKKIHYVPADNPFEVYNFLNTIGEASDGMCIAPLSSKPIALGVCLYSLENPDKVRVVYPSSQNTQEEQTKDVFETIAYELIL